MGERGKVRETAAARVREELRDNDGEARWEPLQRESGHRESGRRESGRQESGRQESGRQESGRQESEPAEEAAVAEPAAIARFRANGARRTADWRRLLAGASPREVLARLMNGDPLDLAAVVEERLRARAYLFDADRVFLRTAARCARLALRYRGDPPLARWLAERADEALLDLLRADAESDLAGEPPGPERLAAFELLARPLGLDPERMHRACLVHNQLPQAQRLAFRELVIEARPLDALAARGERSATEIARAARSALDAVLAVVDRGAAP